MRAYVVVPLTLPSKRRRPIRSVERLLENASGHFASSDQTYRDPDRVYVFTKKRDAQVYCDVLGGPNWRIRAIELSLPPQ